MDLPFQILMQYYYLQHQTLLLPPDTSTAEFFSLFCPAASFFLELFVISLCFYYIGHLPTWGLIFQHHIFLPFHTVHGVLQARTLEWVAISFSSGPDFVRTPPYDPCVLGGPAWLLASLSYTSPFTMTKL